MGYRAARLGPSCPSSKEAPPSSGFLFHTWGRARTWGTHLPARCPSLGKGPCPWEIQAGDFSTSWFSREPGWRGLRQGALVGGAAEGSRTRNWKGKGVGGPRSSPPPPSLLLPIPWSWLALWRQGLGTGLLLGGGEQEDCLQVKRAEAVEAEAPQPPAEACGKGFVISLA